MSFTSKVANTTDDFKRLSDLDEAWSLKLKGPGAGWRMFGRFARKNVFVGLSCYPREECHPWAKYNQLATDMISDWDGRFASGPLRAPNCEDYVSGFFDDRNW